MSPVAVRTVGEPGFALFRGQVERASVTSGCTRSREWPPLGPVPCDRVGYGQRQFGCGTAVLVPEGVAASDLAGNLDEALLVPPAQRVVLLEDEHVVTGGDDVDDQGGAQAALARVEFAPGMTTAATSR